MSKRPLRPRQPASTSRGRRNAAFHHRTRTENPKYRSSLPYGMVCNDCHGAAPVRLLDAAGRFVVPRTSPQSHRSLPPPGGKGMICRSGLTDQRRHPLRVRSLPNTGTITATHVRAYSFRMRFEWSGNPRPHHDRSCDALSLHNSGPRASWPTHIARAASATATT